MYNASLLNSAPCYSPRLSSSPYNAIQRFVMYNATNAATCLWAPQQLATRLRVLRRASIQLNDLFVTSLRTDPHRGAPRRCSTRRFSTICLSIYYYNAPFCIAPPRSSPRLNAPHINATICLLFSHLRAPPLNATCLGAVRRTSPQRNDLFVNLLLLRLSTLRASLPLNAPRFNATQRFVSDVAPPLIASRRATPQRNDLICLLLRFSPHRPAAHHTAPRRSSTQRNELKLN